MRRPAFLWLVLLSAATAAPAQTLFVSIPDFLNIDIGDLRQLDEDNVGDDDTGPNSWTSGYQDAIDFVLDSVADENPDFVLSAGDLVMGRWDRDVDDRNLFGDTSTVAGKEAAIDAAGDFYYGLWKQRFADRGITDVHAAVGDHELGDDRGGKWTGDQAQVVPKYKQEFADHFTAGATDTPAGPAANTAYAVQHDNVLILTLDQFEFDAGAISTNAIARKVDAQQLDWVEQKLADAEADPTIDHVFLQGHLPIDDSPTVPWRTSSQLKYEDGTGSALWQAMVDGGADVYLAGEVHDDSYRKNDGEDLVQIITGGIPGESGSTQYMVGVIDGPVIELTIKDIPIINQGQTNGLWQTGSNRPYADVSLGADPSVRTLGGVTIDKSSGQSVYRDAWGTFEGLNSPLDPNDPSILLATDFTGRTVTGDTASNITYVTNGLADPGDLTALEENPGDDQLAGLFDSGEGIDDFIPVLNTDTADDWAVTVPLTFDAGITSVTIDRLVLDGEMVSAGAAHQVGFPRDTDLRVSVLGSVSGLLASETLETGSQETTWSLTFFDALDPIVLEAGEDWSLRIETLYATEDEVDFEGEEAGNHTGLTGFAIHGSAIPEPATVGLLAVGGIVMLARRRRA